MGEALTFYALAALTLLMAGAVVFNHSIYKSALALVMALAGVAGLFVLLHAEFLAAVQVLIYIGAVTVLIIFAVMLTARIDDHTLPQFNGQRGIAILTAGATLATLLAIFTTSWGQAQEAAAPEMSAGAIQNLGAALLSWYVLPFDIATALLLVALIGAVVIARKEA